MKKNKHLFTVSPYIQYKPYPVMVKITPYSQIINMVIFIPFALITTAFSILIMQAFFILLTVLICKVHLRVRYYHFVALLPVLLFIFTLNSLHGGGEILLRAGPLFIMKQGILRGVFYTIFILELFFMSRVLTVGFKHEELFSAFHTIDRFFKRPGIKNGSSAVRGSGGFMVILYHVLRLFYNTYSELKLFFTLRSLSIKQRVIFLMKKVFLRSIADFKDRGRVVADVMIPNRFDYLNVSFQLLVLFSSLMIHRMWF